LRPIQIAVVCLSFGVDESGLEQLVTLAELAAQEAVMLLFFYFAKAGRLSWWGLRADRELSK